MNKTEEEWHKRYRERESVAKDQGDRWPDCEHPDDWLLDDGVCGYCGKAARND